MEVAIERQRRKNMERELAKLVRKRDNSAAGSTTYQRLNKQVNELKAQLKPRREAVLEEPDDISQYDFRVTRPNNQPRSSGKPRPAKPAARGRPAAGTRRAPTVITESMQKYIALQSRSQQLQYQPALHDQCYSQQPKFELCQSGQWLGGTKRLPSGRAYSKLPAPARTK